MKKLNIKTIFLFLFSVLDPYSSYRSDFIKEEGKSKNIELIYVPVGLTSKYQPLMC